MQLGKTASPTRCLPAPQLHPFQSSAPAAPAPAVPILFSSMGFGKSGALLNAVIIGAVNLLATFVSIYFVEKAGRRKLLLQGGVQMFIAQVGRAGGGRGKAAADMYVPCRLPARACRSSAGPRQRAQCMHPPTRPPACPPARPPARRRWLWL